MTGSDATTTPVRLAARLANDADVDELVRLRAVMLASVSGRDVAPGPWQEAAGSTLRDRIAGGSLAAFVVDRPEEPGRLASCAVGLIEVRLAGPENPSGRIGYVLNVATDPSHRRRGYSTACMAALLDWYRDRGVTTVELRASTEGERIYRALGFAPTADPTMRLRFGPGRPG